MVPMIIIHILEGSVATLARPIVLDDTVEKFLNEGTKLERWTSRGQAIDAIESGDWQSLARLVGVPDDQIECFEGENWDAEREPFLDGILGALEAARASDEDIRFVIQLGQAPGAGFQFDDDAIVVVLKRAA